ncbi:prostaglandin reductase 1-like [Belonocnema kinseyi]|uniref:prostaglandin reductase 1-like n=1 Tax=Belonocnema kinseyi TaxID=2817044 RepID=UPI00143CF375|nr:prostaglandin reductase 1-like [Belonocnema kinseyi]
MVVAKKFVIANHFDGEPKPSDLTLVEEELPPIKDGEYLVKAEYLSVDPYMRVYSLNIPVGSVMIGGQVATIIESKNPKFLVGQKILGRLGWRSHTIIDPKDGDKTTFMNQPPELLPEIGNLPFSLHLGVLGMPGHTSYFGFLEICNPKAGETLVVSGAAGAVGSHVGQIGKIKGLKVIGIAGSDQKCNWLVEELGFNHAINYKTENITDALKKAAPQGVDCYFDNVGGELSTIVMYQMNDFGRIAVCGSISSYNSSDLNDIEKLPKVALVQRIFINKQLKMEGLHVSRWFNRFDESTNQNLKWIREGKLKYRETFTQGFENMFKAFVGMMHGENVGKAIVKV